MIKIIRKFINEQY